MTIKEVSEKYGISQDTLRYYERIGLIPPVPRTPGGIRDYQEKDLGWVEQAVCMRSAGVQIEALIEYVRLYQMGDSAIEHAEIFYRNSMKCWRNSGDRSMQRWNG